jgi:glycyl-tRNA synthetase beta chain
VIATRPRSPLDFDARVRALLRFLALPEAASLTAANKRIANLLSKSAGGGSGNTHIDEQLLRIDAERALLQAVLSAEHSVPGRIATGEYTMALGSTLSTS